MSTPPSGQQGWAPGQAQQARRPRRWPWVLGIAVALFAGVGIGAAGGTSDAPKPAVAPTPTTVTVTVTAPAPPAAAPTTIVKTITKTVTVTPAASVAIPGDGTFLVGADIRPGTYRSGVPDSGNCYWARLATVNTSDIIDNSNSSGPSVVTIKASDKAFESSGCGEWRKVR